MFDDKRFHIIPSVRDLRYLEKALKSREDWVQLSCSHLGNLKETVRLCHKAGKRVIINHEIVGGLGSDRMAFALMKKMFEVDAVMGGSNTKLMMAKKEEMYTIRRVALEDSLAVDQVLGTMKETKCDVIELRPAYYAVRYLPIFQRKKMCTYVAGGFVDSPEALKAVYDAGFSGATTSCTDLWNITY